MNIDPSALSATLRIEKITFSMPLNTLLPKPPPLVISPRAVEGVAKAAPLGADCFASSLAARLCILLSSLCLSILFKRVDCHFLIAPATGECRQFCQTFTLCRIMKKLSA